MTEFLNLPTGEDMRRVADAVERMACLLYTSDAADE